MALASVDLGGTNIAAVIGTTEGEILAERQIPTDSHLGPHVVLDRIAVLLKEMVPEGVEALGLGVPGLVNLNEGKTLFLPNLPTQWRNIAAASLLEASLGCPVYLLNDARMAALGELDFGHGRSVRDFVFFTLGTGIGGGIVLDGRLRMGALGSAGELGHQTVVADGPLCGCGSRGCLELFSSAPALIAEAVRLIRMGQAPHLLQLVGGDLNQVSPILMTQAKDASVAAAIERAAHYLGIGVANVVTTLHPEMVVIGGGLAQMGERLLAPLREEVTRRVKMFPIDNVKIEASLTGARAGTLGGLALARRRGMI